MTIGQARIIAIIISLTYIPAFIFGVICIWLALMAVAVIYLSNSHLNRAAIQLEGLSSNRGKAYSALASAGLISLESIAIASTPQLAVLALNNSAGIKSITLYPLFELPDAAFYDGVTQLFSKIFIHTLSYADMGLDDRVLLHSVSLSILIAIALMLGSRHHSKRLFLGAAGDANTIAPQGYGGQIYLEYSFFKSGFGLCVVPCLTWLAWAFGIESIKTGYFETLNIVGQLMFLTSIIAFSYIVFFSISYSLACSHRGAHVNRR